MRAYAYPTGAPELFCCFDQPDLPAPLSLSVRAPAGWSVVANGAVADRPAGGEGTWRFAPIRLKPLSSSSAPLRCPAPHRCPGRPARRGAAAAPFPAAPPDAPLPPLRSRVALTSYGRAGLAATRRLPREVPRDRGRGAEHESGSSGCRARTCIADLVALPDVPFRASCVPGLMVVGEDLLTRLADPDDDFAGMIAAHEVAHLWFGGLVGMPAGGTTCG